MSRGRIHAAPTVVYGDGARHQLPRVVADLGADRVLLLTGKASFAASGAAEVLPALEAVADVCRWAAFDPNPRAEDLAAGLALAGGHRPSAIVAVGGGSVLDMAKLLAGYHDVDPAEAAAAVAADRPPATTRAAALVLAPTTSGSGAEATHFAVCYEGQRKHSVAGPALRADAILLDPSLTVSGSPAQRATSAIDAICQAAESRWAVKGTARSRRWAQRALGLLLGAVEPFVLDADPQAARAMQLGSHLAGRAIDVSTTTAAHALSYALTQRFGVPHGEAVALTFGCFLADHAAAAPGDLQDRVDPAAHAAAMSALLRAFGAVDGQDAAAVFTRLQQRLGLATSLAEVGVRPDDLDGLARAVNTQRLGNNPRRYDTAGLVDVLQRAL